MKKSEDPLDPLVESAPLAWQLAPQLCRKDPATGEDCAWEHGMWQYLRLTGLVGSIESRASFYAGALERVEEQGERAPPGKSPGPSRSPRTPTTGTGALRVLLSGTADYALLALVARGLCKRGVVPAVTAIDLCGTPLALNRWYAERAAVRLETVHTDILHYRAAQPFDAVCTDNFL